jgi:hypothetical protein
LTNTKRLRIVVKLDVVMVPVCQRLRVKVMVSWVEELPVVISVGTLLAKAVGVPPLTVARCT